MALMWFGHKYGSGETAKVGPGLVLRISYEGVERLPADEPKFNVVVFGEALPGRSATLEEGKDRAVAEGISRLQTALAKMTA